MSEWMAYPRERKMHLQLCYSSANAAPDAVAKGNWAKVVNAVCGMFP